MSLTDAGVALRSQAELIPGAVMERLGMSIPELEQLHATLAAFRTAAELANGAPR